MYDEGIRDETKMAPVLLAVANGHWKVLETFKRHFTVQQHLSTQFPTIFPNKPFLPFSVWTSDTHETVLHLALKGPFVIASKVRHIFLLQ